MHLQFVDAVSLQDYPANVPPIYQQLTAGENVASPTEESNEPWLLWRKNHVIHWRSLDAIEKAALEAATSGATFGALCEQLTKHLSEAEVPATAMQLLLQWCNDELIHQFKT